MRKSGRTKKHRVTRNGRMRMANLRRKAKKLRIKDQLNSNEKN